MSLIPTIQKLLSFPQASLIQEAVCSVVSEKTCEEKVIPITSRLEKGYLMTLEPVVGSAVSAKISKLFQASAAKAASAIAQSIVASKEDEFSAPQPRQYI